MMIIQEPGKPVILLAHNGKTFDFPFLIREMNRCGYDIPNHLRFFDTLPLVRKLVDSNGNFFFPLLFVSFVFSPSFSGVLRSVGAWKCVRVVGCCQHDFFFSYINMLSRREINYQL
jgi:DNA polymerase III epsilon subunit-like protein